MKKTRTNTVKKTVKTTKSKKVTSNTTDKVVLTFKQAKAIEEMLFKLGKSSKVLSTKLAKI